MAPVTTSPALSHTPRDHLAGLSGKRSAILARAARGKERHRMVVHGLLDAHNWDEEVVEDAWETLSGCLRERMPSARVADYLGYEACGAPKACTVLLEDGRGGVARDVAGFPLCVSFGIAPAIDPDTAMRATAWMSERVRDHATDREIPQTTNVVDLLCRKHLDAGKSIPMPDAKAVELSSLLPNASTKVYVCGASREFRAFVEAVGKLPGLRRYVDNLVLCDDYSVLRGVIPKEHMLPWWDEGASFDFDLDRYAAWLREE